MSPDGPVRAREDADTFPRRLREAVERLEPDGRFRPSDARALRSSLRSHLAARRNLLAEPETVLGPFDSLPEEARRALVDALREDGRWRMAAYNLGPLHAGLGRAFWRAASRLPYGRFARPAIEFLAASVQAAPYFALHAAYRRYLAFRAQFRRRPSPLEVLSGAGVEIRNLAVRYARGIPQLQAYQGFWHDPARQTTVGLIVGLDFIENREGYWFTEANMDCGLLPERTAIYREDPFVRSLLDVASEGGYGRLMVLSGNSSIEPAMTRQFRAGAQARRLALTILEDRFHPRFGHSRAVGCPRLDEPGTLLVRNRHYRTGVDYVVQHKWASSRALRIYQEESGDASFRLPVSSLEPCVAPADHSDPFPNVVFKYPERDKGEGVFFLKVSSAAHAKQVLAETVRRAPPGGALSRLYARLDDAQGLFQPYVRTPMLPDRRLYRTRAHVLLTPVGVHFLSAHRIVCSKPVPERLPMGIVPDQSPYVVSYAGDARFALLPPEEEPAVTAAALGVARGLARAISLGFQTGPAGSPNSDGFSERDLPRTASSGERR